MVWRQKAKIYRLTTSCLFLQHSLRLSFSQVFSQNWAPVGALTEFLFQMQQWQGQEGRRSNCNLTIPLQEGIPGTQVLPDKAWWKGIQSGCFSVLEFKAEGDDGVRKKRCELNQLQGHKWSGFSHDFKLGGPQKAKSSALCICSLTIWLWPVNLPYNCWWFAHYISLIAVSLMCLHQSKLKQWNYVFT